MSNSPLVNYTKISPNRGNTINGVWKPERTQKIDTVTIHCVVGQCSVETLGNIFAPTSRKASSNYGIGPDGRIGMYVEEKDRAWTSSSADNDNRAITIEVASDTTAPYAVNYKAYASLIDLLVDICERNDIKELKWRDDKSLIGQVDKQNMTIHRWFAATACPGDFLYSHMGSIAAAVNEKLKGNDIKMDEKTFEQLLNEYRATLKDNEADTYSEEARDWAVSTGLIKGSGVDETGEPNYMWQDFLTREQLVTVLYRFAKSIGKA
jgi:hypothetical protein